MYRPMDQRDVTEVHQIERRVYLSPWTCKEIREHLDSGLGTVHVERRRIVAYALYGQSKNRFILARLVVHPSHRRQGFGSDMLWYIGSDRQVVAYIPEEDLEVQQFMRAAGYKCTRIKHGFFSNNGTAYMFRNRQGVLR